MTEAGRDAGKLRFIHLRVHSAYSLLEGALPLKTILSAAVADRQPAIAITDTNNLFGALEFSVKAVEKGLQPIIGCQIDIDMQDGEEGERRSHREQVERLPALVLIAADQGGYRRLVDLVSRAYLEGSGSEPAHIRLDWLGGGVRRPDRPDGGPVRAGRSCARPGKPRQGRGAAAHAQAAFPGSPLCRTAAPRRLRPAARGPRC